MSNNPSEDQRSKPGIRAYLVAFLLLCLTVFVMGYRHFEAPGASLPGIVGQVDGNSRSVSGNKEAAACLSYGPYIFLSEGVYFFKMEYTAGSDSSGSYDIVYQGASALKKTGNFRSNGGPVKVKVRIKGRESQNAWEFRSWHSGKGDLSIHKISITGFSSYPVLSALFNSKAIGGLPAAVKVAYNLILTILLFIALLFAVTAWVRYLPVFLRILRKTGLSRDYKINLTGLVILIGFCVSVFYHYIMGIYFNASYPYNTFLFDPVIKFTDFFRSCSFVSELNPYFDSNIKFNYYPFAHISIYPFSLMKQWAGLFTYFAIFISVFMIYTVKNIKVDSALDNARNFLIFTFLSYPFLFILDRGNIEGLLFVFLVFFLAFYIKGRYFLSALFLSLAIAMKAFPAVFVVLFLSDKKYKYLILIPAMVLALTLLCNMAFQGDYASNFNYVRSGFGSFHSIPLQRGMSLAMFVNAVMIYLKINTPANLDRFMSFYLVLSPLVFMFISACVVLLRMELWKKVALLVFSMLLLPNISVDYKLMSVFLPLYLFINSRNATRFDFLYSLLFGLLLIPKDYYIPAVDKIIIHFSIVSVTSNIVILITMFCLILNEEISRYCRELPARKAGSK